MTKHLIMVNLMKKPKTTKQCKCDKALKDTDCRRKKREIKNTRMQTPRNTAAN